MLFVLVLASCKCNQVTQRDTTTRDSISYVERFHTDTVSIPGDTITLTAWIECDSITNKPKPVTGRSGSSRGSATVTVDSSGKLMANVILNQYKAQVQRLSKELFRARQEREVVVEVRTKYKTRTIDIYCRWFTGISLLVGILWVLWQIYKPRFL